MELNDNFRTGHLPPGIPTLFGRPIEQVLSVLPAFDRLFAEFKPKRILEWGTGCGGFTVYLAVWAQLLQAELMTVDRTDHQKAGEFLARLYGLPIAVRRLDFYEDPMLAGIGWLIPRAPSLVLLDGDVDKGRLLRFAAPLLKAGDVFMVHDYKPDDEPVDKMNQVPADAIDFAVNECGYEPYLQDVFNAHWSHWLCLRKR